MGPKDKGEFAESKIVAALKRRGLAVLQPFGDNQRYDLVVDWNDSFISVQCKMARESKSGGSVVFACQSVDCRDGTRSNYKGEVDLFGVFAPTIDSCFLVPVEDAGIKSMSLRYEQPKTSSGNINWATDYII